MKPRVLASDLDGTLIPLAENAQNLADLSRLKHELQTAGMKLAFVTGRHFESVAQVMHQMRLPQPDWILCDVGTSIYLRAERGYQLSSDYYAHLGQIIGGFTTHQLSLDLAGIDSLRLQEAEKQAAYKLSYYVDIAQLDECVQAVQQRLAERQAPYSVIASQDPFTGVGLVDLLPHKVSKAYALEWWAESTQHAYGEIVFAGDSGNDSAAFAQGFRSIVVANASAEVLRQAQQAHAAAGWHDRLFAAPEPATSGVLAGLRHFLQHQQMPS